MEKKCGNCRYWEVVENAETGKCHRYAPKAVMGAPKSGSYTFWPVTGSDCIFCGDWKPKDEEKKGKKFGDWRRDYQKEKDEMKKDEIPET